MSQPYVILARKYRPQNFDEVVGQKAIVSTLVQGLKTGRLAQAWLMCGPSGVGKTTLARILARCLNCTGVDQPTEAPCGECPSCKGILEGDSLDLLEIDGASNNRVDEVRTLQEHIAFRPQQSRYRIVLIDEVHMLSTAAFNALLKTLEEPPEHVKFIFATTEPERILPTVRARCQRFDFFSVSVTDLKLHIEGVASREKIVLEEGCAEAIAGLAGGSVRNSLSLLDQLSADGKVTLEEVQQLSGQALPEHVKQLCEMVWQGQSKEAIELIDRLSDEAVDLKALTEQWAVMLRQSLEQKIGALEHKLQLPENVSVQTLIYQGKLVLNLLQDLAHESSPRMALILTVAKLAAQDDIRPLVDLIEKLPPHFDAQHGGAPTPTPRPELSAPPPDYRGGPEPIDEVPAPTRELIRSSIVEEEASPPAYEPPPEEVPVPTSTQHTMLNLQSLRDMLMESGQRAASSFLNEAEMHIEGSSVTIQPASALFKGLLEAETNREAILTILRKYIPSPQLKIVSEESLIQRSEEEETSQETPPDIGPGAMERKVLDMFNGEKLK